MISASLTIFPKSVSVNILTMYDLAAKAFKKRVWHRNPRQANQASRTVALRHLGQTSILSQFIYCNYSVFQVEKICILHISGLKVGGATPKSQFGEATLSVNQLYSTCEIHGRGYPAFPRFWSAS